MHRLLVLLLSVSLLAAACGDDGSSADPDDTAADDTGADDTAADDTGADDTAADDTAADDTAPDDTGADDTAADDTAPDDTGADDGGGDDGGGGAGVGTSFCDAYVDDEIRFDGLSLATATPEEIESAIRASLDTARSVADDAPGEIRDDVDTLISSFEVVIEELEAVDWNFLLIDPNSPAFDDPAAEAAGDRIDAFCGVAEPDPVPGEIPPGLLPDPDLLDDLQNSDNPEEAALLFYRALGHDEETAQCLLDELGALGNTDDVDPDLFTQEFCGMTILEIFAGGPG